MSRTQTRATRENAAVARALAAEADLPPVDVNAMPTLPAYPLVRMTHTGTDEVREVRKGKPGYWMLVEEGWREQ